MTALDLSLLRALSQRLAELLGDDAPSTLRTFRFDCDADEHELGENTKRDRLIATQIEAVAVDLFAAAPTDEPHHPAWDALLSWRQTAEGALSRLPARTTKRPHAGRRTP